MLNLNYVENNYTRCLISYQIIKTYSSLSSLSLTYGSCSKIHTRGGPVAGTVTWLLKLTQSLENLMGCGQSAFR